jgi:hypothetical protein
LPSPGAREKSEATSRRNFGKVELFAAPPGKIFPRPAFLAQTRLPPGKSRRDVCS